MREGRLEGNQEKIKSKSKGKNKADDRTYIMSKQNVMHEKNNWAAVNCNDTSNRAKMNISSKVALKISVPFNKGNLA